MTEKHHEHSSDTWHIFEYRSVEKKKLILSLIVTLLFMLVEIIGGIISGSIALISDAGHMFTHAFAIGIGLFAILIARKPPCHHRTFGLYRAEILAAFVNGIFLLAVAIFIIYESITRIFEPKEVLGLEMLVIAIIGLVANLASIFILKGSSKSDMNVRSVFYHMLADVFSSVGVIAAALFIYFFDWKIFDPLVSIGISLVIVFWAFGVLKESAMILLEMAPSEDTDEIAESLKKKFPDIVEVMSSHLWAITSDMLVFSAHVKFKSESDGIFLIPEITRYLNERHNIIESTIQVALEGDEEICKIPT